MAFIAIVVIALHILGWGGIWMLAGADHSTLAGLAVLAYMFGARHAFDVDHIAAIDNTTRRLIATVRQPYTVGLWFSLGHSTIVFIMTAAIATFTQTTWEALPTLQAAGQVVGTTISGVFLLLIAVINLMVLINAHREGNVLPRWFGRVFRLVEQPWQLYFVGGLFGLGFDTATEIGLLTMAAIAASQTVPVMAVLCLPVVFAAGMTLLDSANGIVMCRAYGWAFVNPARKVGYNLVITGVSVVVAVVIGTMELASVVFGLE